MDSNFLSPIAALVVAAFLGGCASKSSGGEGSGAEVETATSDRIYEIETGDHREGTASEQLPEGDREFEEGDARLAEGIVQRDEHHYEIRRSAFDAMLEDPAALSQGPYIVPALRDGKSEGLKLQAINPGSVFDRLGLSSGDIVTTINGHALSTPDNALWAYTQVRDAERIVVDVIRSDRTVRLTYDIVGPRERADEADMGDPRGWSVLDQLPDGGLAPGELGVLVGEGIVQRDEHHYEISRPALDAVLENTAAAVQGARIVPSVRDGKPHGFVLYAVRPSSVFGRLGLSNGDTISAINGIDLTTPDDVFRAYKSVRDADRIVVDVLRLGRTVRLSYEIRGS
jgi:type II secretory pathway component PulC